ncbi:DNA methyltransferase [Polyangium jinanense]|uniref:site-specific DNA-methyltransferase (adenine-specific) n=1 Tax=Polyangium jinanense TaxID=2829994 RepID=A0A9X4AXH0_9BACT|nr:DNA methyltransferase [Polyangium jinanense]MDC3962101.1 N-6 DNA methylase [Polyangium jinanense]MDC3988384.1 N-6 DNA methylase [Polyangium jinanense]
MHAPSPKRNADVTTDLSRQVFEALEVLLAGFSAAEERDGTHALRAALERDDDHLYAGLLTLLLRLVFLLYCEEWGLLPMENPLFAENYSLLRLFGALQSDHGKYPDTIHRRFGAYPRLVALFRGVFLGVTHRDLRIPPRRGQLFDPNVYPFLEGFRPEGSAALSLPSVDDGTVYSVLEKLLYLGGQRLSYKALDVEQIGSVYEALMGFSVRRIESGAVRIKLDRKKGMARVWVEAGPLLAVPANQRERWLQDELAFDKAVAAKIAEAVKSTKTADQALAALEPLSGRTPERASVGTLVIQPGPERRRTSSHYTPRELTEPIVARTLAPLIKAMGEAPSSEALLNLVICDPAVGSGAFLVAACRYLADRVVAAWTREGAPEKVASAHEDVVNHARRLVAQRCLYGVDKNTYAVQLARLSLWLVTMARNEPFTFVDHAIRHGDSLVGLSFDQVRAFHWKPRAQVEHSAGLLVEALEEASGIRKRILDLAIEGTYEAQREKERLLFDAEDALGRVRLIADLVVGAFFSQKNDKERDKERDLRLGRVTAWLAAEKRGDVSGAEEILAELRTMQAEVRQTQVPFHWMIEFPEVFGPGRPDPLEGNRVTGTAWVDAFVGNPPFKGGSGISSEFGEGYRDWLLASHEGAHGNSDIVAHFFRRAASHIGANGVMGFITTNTIGQGDTRSTGLRYLLANGFAVCSADVDWVWPGDAAVVVSVVHLGVGRGRTEHAMLNGRRVVAVNSRLRPAPERPDPVVLSSNASMSFLGSKTYGQGFLLTPEERDALVTRDRRNAERIFPYLGGEEVNTRPTQSFDRFVINFGQMTLEEAETWPDLIEIVRQKVKPERDKNNRDVRRIHWWRFGEVAPALYAAIAPLSRCLATARVSKHMMLAFQPTSRVFSEQLCVFPIDCFAAFATLQSRIHEPWARLLSSSMKTDLRYSASDCFETFPFPAPDPRTVFPSLESIGERLYETRARFMVDTSQGLTKNYNALKDPSCEDPRILELRALHEEMDQLVLAAYGWSDLPVPPYCALSDEDRAAQQRFEDEVIDKLFVLNAERAEQEKKGGKPEGGGRGKRARCTRSRTS